MDSLSFYITKAIVSIALRRKVLHPFFSTEIIIKKNAFPQNAVVNR